MPTEFIREKINHLQSLVMSEDVQVMHHQLQVDAAVESTGDAQVDANMKASAQNSEAYMLAANARLKVYRAKLDELQKELGA